MPGSRGSDDRGPRPAGHVAGRAETGGNADLDGSTFGGAPALAVAGANGGAIVLAADNGGGQADTILDFTNAFVPTTAFGNVGLSDPTGNGFDVYFEATSGGFSYTVFDPMAGSFDSFFTGDPGFANTTDVQAIGNDPTTGVALFSRFGAREVRSVSTTGGNAAAIEQRIAAEAFVGVSGNPVSAFAATVDGVIVGVTNGNEVDIPGDIFLHSGGPTDEVVKVGSAGLSPRRICCADGFCAVTNFADGSYTKVIGTPGFPVVLTTATEPAGDGPVGCDVIATGAVGGDAPAYQLVTTGFLDDTFQVDLLDAQGMVIGSTTIDAPASCVSPGHAIWLETSRFAATCNGSDNLAIVTLP